MPPPPTDSDRPTYTASYERFREALHVALAGHHGGACHHVSDGDMDTLADAISDIAVATFYDEGGKRHPGAEPDPAEIAGRIREAAVHPDTSALHESIRAENPDSSEAHNLIRAIQTLLGHYGYPRAGLTLDLIQRICVEARQYREAHAHSQQLRDHYQRALSALVEALRIDGERDGIRSEAMVTAVQAARGALDNPPAWDGRLGTAPPISEGYYKAADRILPTLRAALARSLSDEGL